MVILLYTTKKVTPNLNVPNHAMNRLRGVLGLKILFVEHAFRETEILEARDNFESIKMHNSNDCPVGMMLAFMVTVGSMSIGFNYFVFTHYQIAHQNM